MAEQQPENTTKNGADAGSDAADANVADVRAEGAAAIDARAAGDTSREVAESTPPASVNDAVGASAGSAGRPVLALMLAVALAVVVYVAATRVQGSMPAYITIGLAMLSLAGLIGIFGALAGFVHFGRTPRQKAFFDKLLDAMGEPCVVTDSRGAIVYSNELYQRLVSDAGHARVVNFETLYSGYPDVSERVYRLSKAARDGGDTFEQFRLSAGSAAAGAHEDRAAWLRLHVKPIRVSATQNFTVWRLSDETDARTSQEDAFENLQYIINYLDHAPAGFFSSTRDGAIAYVNATLADWLGLDLSRTTDGQLTLADIVSEQGAKLLAGIEPEPGRPVTEVFDLELATQNDEVLPARVVHRCEYDDDGKQLPSRTLVLDRRAFAASEPETDKGQFSQLFNALPIGVVQVNGEGVMQQFNAAFVDIAPGAKRRGKIGKLVLEDERDGLEKLIAEAAAGAQSDTSADFRFEGKQESSAKLSFVADEAGGDGAVMVFAVDTTQHASLEVQLAQSQKMQAVGQLAGGVAHDFNNVLTAIIGFSDLLLARHRPTDPSFADIMNIKQNANRAANLVRQLLAFSRRQTLRPEVLSLTDVLSDLGNLLGRLLGEVVELKIIHGRDLSLVKVDVNQFEQVVINLCVNARDAMPDGGTLTLKTSDVSDVQVAEHANNPEIVPPGDYVLLEVTDTGTGMPPEVLDKIYDPFFSTKEVGKGTGLGLSTVYGIIKQTGGFIFCDSEVGRGTTFRVYLPKHVETEEEEAARVAAASDTEVKGEDLTGSGTILLVEDEDAVRSFAKRALESRGYTVLEADSGEVALEVLEEYGDEPDLVVSDVVMPEMDGPTMLGELRKRGIKTKVVFVSGYAEDAFEKNLEGQTDFAFLPKPFTLKQLAEAVKENMG